MKEKFEVIKIECETMTLKSSREGGCQSCSANTSCGTGILASYFEQYSVFRKPLKNGANVGDLITLEISSGELFWRAFQLYILPLFGLFIGAILGEFYAPANEFWQITLALAGFFGALIGVKYFIK
jgi:sigma-E factor negative regulatory protein RseC